MNLELGGYLINLFLGGFSFLCVCVCVQGMI